MCKGNLGMFLTGAGRSLGEALWGRRALLCSEGGKGAFGEEGGLDFVMRSLWGYAVRSEGLCSAPRSSVVGQWSTA